MSIRYPIDGSRDALWMATAVEAPDTNSLSDDLHCDVAIVGAGLTGLNAALSLAKAGKSVCVLEAKSIGFGASGRSGGQVNLGLNSGPDALIEKYGEEQGRRLIDAVINTPSMVFSHIAEHGLKCDAVQSGWIQGAVNQAVSAQQDAMAEEYQRYGCELQLLDRQTIQERTGTDFYRSGLLSATAGSVQPLSYTRELARVAKELGVKIFTQSPVQSLSQRGEQWLLQSLAGSVLCDKVLVATNGYTDGLVHGLAQKVVPVRSLLMATEPLSDQLRESVLPKHMSFVDKRRLILYFRYDRDGRLCAGYRGPMRDSFRIEDFDELKQKVVKIFPKLKQTRWDYHWGGRIAMSKDALPFIAEPLPGVLACMAYNGRGVGMGTVFGQCAAQHLQGVDSREIAIPLSRPDKFLMHRFHVPGVKLSILWFELNEMLDAMLRSK